MTFPSVTRGMTIHAITLTAFLAASSAPTPLYRLYQHLWQFSPLLLTVIFAVYALTLLVALVVAGSLSDYCGRRPVITLALVLEIVSMGMFVVAGDPAWLIGARLVQGAATGLATASLSAALIDLHRDHGALINSLTTMAGMAVGALGATALVAWNAAPLVSTYVVLVAVFLLQLVLTWTVAETAARRPGMWASLRPTIRVPAPARWPLARLLPINTGIWMLGGFFMTLMPSLIASEVGANSVWLAGLVVVALTVSGGLAILVLRRRPAGWGVAGGALALIAGLVAILAGVDSGWPMLLMGGSVVAGVGFGAGFMGVSRSVLPLAGPGERAGLTSAFYVLCYLSNSVPVVLAGLGARQLGLVPTANLYGAAILTLVVVGLGWRWKAARRAA